jgi:hypothetical protein
MCVFFHAYEAIFAVKKQMFKSNSSGCCVTLGLAGETTLCSDDNKRTGGWPRLARGEAVIFMVLPRATKVNSIILLIRFYAMCE